LAHSAARDRVDKTFFLLKRGTMSPSPSKTRKWKRWVLAAVIAALAIVVGGPFVYFNFIEGKAPAKLSLATTPVPSSAATGTRAPLTGTWKIGSGSLVRYRVKETLFGQSHTAVGGTSSVTGSMTIAGTKVTTATFTVDMTSITSGQSQRDGQVQGRIMDTTDFPTATFKLTSPIDLDTVPKDGVLKPYSANGTLQLHGTTKNVTFTLTARRTGNVIAVQGDEPITFSDYNINNPSGGPASVGNSGQLEFVLQFQPT
jgi:polyisoprenoid-binding protein YceI